MKKKVEIAVAVTVAVIVLSVMNYLLGIFRFPIDIREYVANNSEKLTAFAEELYQKQEEDIEIYYWVWEVPIEAKKEINPFNKLAIISISVAKSSGDGRQDLVRFMLKGQPEKQGYWTRGIYYSPNDVLLDIHRVAQEGDYYEIDSSESHEKSRYRSEKICDHWYYYEEAVW
ncbi:hypothetical protein [Butyrivibrio sp. AE3009]|uniref:hypothetical protein n=1 Tax=Butyrivibrio sp. AE3009 TaxID=1280666 RepID=UPI0003B64A67|nr:hypothetical protein [Butyrivibrio sp. AE3009]